MIIVFETEEEQLAWSQPDNNEQLDKLKDFIVSMGVTDIKTEYPDIT